MIRITKYYALVFACILAIGETYILLTTDKFWPLSLDDYFVVLLLTLGAINIKSLKGILLIICAWAFSIGNLYAMLFTRLIPETGSGERIGILALLIGLSAIGLFLSLRTLISRQ